MGASNIKGITIEIDGNTSKLSSALRDVNQEARDTNKSLRDIEKSIKYNPKNTELLAQKQRELGNAVNNTREKLDYLKKAQSQMSDEFRSTEEGQRAYDNLTREIIATENQLKSLEKELKNANSEAYQFGEKMKSTGTKMQDMGKAFAPISAAAGATSLAGIKMATDFEDSLAKISTLLGDTGISADDLKGAIIQMSNESGKSVQDLGDAIYQALSSSVDPDKVIDFTKTASKLAVAGFTETSTAVDVLTTAINAYGLEAEDAGRISEYLVVAQNEGKTTVDELAQSMGKVIPTASNLNVGIDELSGAYAVLTKNGIRTNEAGTAINAMLNELGRSGSKTDKILREQTGKSFADLKAEGIPLGEVLQILSQYAEDNGVKMSDLFTNINAGKGAMSLMTGEGQQLNEVMDAIAGSAGIVDENFDKVKNTAGETLRDALNRLKNTILELGDTVMPIVADLAEKFNELTQRFSELSPEAKKVLMVFLLLTSAIAPLLIGLGKLIFFGGELIQFFSGAGAGATALSTATEFLGGKFTLLTGIVGAVIAIIILLITHWDEVKEVASNVGDFIVDKWTYVKEFFSTIWDGVKDAWSAFWDPLGNWFVEKWNNAINVLSPHLETMKNIFEVLWVSVQEVFKFAWELLTGILKSSWEFILDLAKFMWEAIKGAILIIWDPIKSKITTIWNAIKSFLESIWNAIKGVAENVFGAIKDKISQIWDSVKSFTTEKWNSIKGFLNPLWEGLRTTATNKFNSIKDTVSQKWDNIKSKTDSTWGSIKSNTQSSWNSIKSHIETPMNSAKNRVSSLADTMKSKLSGTWDNIRSLASSKWEAIKNAISRPMERARDAVSNAVNRMKSVLHVTLPTPRLKLPHPRVSGSFSLNPPRVPHFSIDWYKKGAIFTKPTLFDTPYGMKGVGEAGAEAVLPIEKLSGLMADAMRINEKQSGSGEILITGNTFNIREEQDIDKIARELYRLIETKKRGVGLG